MNKSIRLYENAVKSLDKPEIFNRQKERSLVQYAVGGDSNSPTTKTKDVLEARIYKINSTMNGQIFFTREYLNTDELLRFDDSRYNEVLEEIDKFWLLEESYKKLGFTHKRGIVLYGAPGVGKSCLLKLAMENVTGAGHVVFLGNNDAHLLTEGLKKFKEVEPNRKCLVIIEEVDESYRYNEVTMLNLLDGDNQLDHILFLATTNYLERMSPRFLRPGRFDRKIQVHVPPREGRLAYLKSKLGLNEDEAVLEELADETIGFSFGEMREFLIGTYCLKNDKAKVIKRLRTGVEESLKGPNEKDQKFFAIKMNNDGEPVSVQVMTLLNEGKEKDPKDKYKALQKFECMECRAKFKKVLRKSTDEVKCPECGSTDVELG